MKIENLKDKNIAILGFGVEGQSSLDFLKKHNITNKITILDTNENIEKQDNINYILGKKYLDNLDKFDAIIKTSGISPYNKKVNKYLNKITSQVKIFFDNYKSGKIIAITATKGKSTTSSLIYNVLKTAGYKTKLVGNIGNPFLSEIDLDENYDYIVCELSSYMLDGLNKANYISVLGNIYPDHLDYHGGFENYKNAKLNILNGSDINIVRDNIEADFSEYNNIKFFGKDRKNSFSYEEKTKNFYKNGNLFGKIDSKLQGEHNLINITSVIAVCDSIGVNFSYIKTGIENFNSLPHRLENIGTYNGIIFVDDAISTTPESTIEAIKTYGNKIGTIFLGGKDRGYKYNELLKYLEKYEIKNIVVFPEIYDKISALLTGEENILYTDSMKKAVKFAFNNTKAREICLLSTAAPSYNLWKNFEEKAEEFKKYVKKYSKK